MAVGAGLGAWGVINLMAGGGIVLIGLKLIPLLAGVLN